MEQNLMKLFFALLRAAIADGNLSEDERALYNDELFHKLMNAAKAHDILNIIAVGLKKSNLSPQNTALLEKEIMKAVYRYRQLKYDYDKLCDALEKAEIPFIPLKGSVIRDSYPQPWMRTSCDIDVLISSQNLDSAVAYLVSNLNYVTTGHSSHDVSLHTPQNIHIELHYDLVEEGRANKANEILATVWDNVSLCEGCNYHYKMTDEFFYFYHIAHMAKHFEVGGCGIRPFMDLLILDSAEETDCDARNELLKKGELLQFANAARKLSRVWFAAEETDSLSEKMQDYIIKGGVFGSPSNRVALQQGKKGGKIKYIFSRIFIPYSRLKGYYPVLEKHKWLTPFMQIRRWFMLLKPDVIARTKQEIKTNTDLDKSTATEMNKFLDELGL